MHLEICKLRALRPSFLQFRGTIRTLAKPFELSPFGLGSTAAALGGGEGALAVGFPSKTWTFSGAAGELGIAGAAGGVAGPGGPRGGGGPCRGAGGSGPGTGLLLCATSTAIELMTACTCLSGAP